MGGLHRELLCSLPDGRDLSERLCASAPSRSRFVHLTRLPTSFLRPEVQSWQPLHDMVLVVRRCRSCAAFLPGRSSTFPRLLICSATASPMPYESETVSHTHQPKFATTSTRLHGVTLDSRPTKSFHRVTTSDSFCSTRAPVLCEGPQQATYFEHYAHLYYEMTAPHLPGSNRSKRRLTMPSAR